jgi:omega-amidase
MLLKVTTIQYDIIWENAKGNTQKLDALLATQVKLDTNLIVLPEMFTTGFTMLPQPIAETMDGGTVQWMHEKSKQYNATICGSLIIKDNDKFYNRFIAIAPNGQVNTYNKKHLFAKAGEHETFTAGVENAIFSINDFNILPLICYDIRFPVWCRNTLQPNGRPAYDVILVVANWPDTRIGHWESLLVARAIENQCYVIAVNRVGVDGNEHEYNGYTMVVAPTGSIAFKIINKELLYTTTLSMDLLNEVRTQLPFLKDADAFKLV